MIFFLSRYMKSVKVINQRTVMMGIKTYPMMNLISSAKIMLKNNNIKARAPCIHGVEIPIHVIPT